MASLIHSLFFKYGTPLSIMEVMRETELDFDSIVTLISNTDIVVDKTHLKCSRYKDRFTPKPNITSSQLNVAFVVESLHTSVILLFDGSTPRIIPATLPYFSSLSFNTVFVTGSDLIPPSNCTVLGHIPNLSIISRDPLFGIPIFYNELPTDTRGFISAPGNLNVTNFYSAFQHYSSAHMLSSKLSRSLTPIMVRSSLVKFFVFNSNLHHHDTKGRFVNIATKYGIKFTFTKSTLGEEHKTVHCVTLTYVINDSEHHSHGCASSLREAEDDACEKASAFIAVIYGYQTSMIKQQIIKILAFTAAGVLPKEVVQVSNNFSTVTVSIKGYRFTATSQTVESAREQCYFLMSLKIKEIVIAIRDDLKLTGLINDRLYY